MSGRVQPCICPECGRHTAVLEDGIVLRHSDYRLLPMRVWPCPQSERPLEGSQ